MTSREMPKNRKIMVVDEDTHTSMVTVVEFHKCFWGNSPDFYILVNKLTRFYKKF